MFTQENTQGFTAAQIEMLNAALAIVQREIPDADESNINDAINNAWNDQDTAGELAADALRLL
jgi:hypothetical protein